MPDFAYSPVDPELCVRLGQIVTKWTTIEKLVSWLLGTCLLADIAAVSHITNGISISTQIKWIRALTGAHEHEKEQNARVIALLTHAEELRQERNEFVHGTWDPTDCDPHTCLVETVNLDRTEIIKSRLVTTHDLDDLSSEIDRWIGDYVSLGRELGFPRNRGTGKSIFAD